VKERTLFPLQGSRGSTSAMAAALKWSRRSEMFPLSGVLPVGLLAGAVFYAVYLTCARRRDGKKKLLELLIAKAGEPPVNRTHRDAA